MYAVIVFALVLLSPMPFVSPFGHIVQDVAAQSPFGPSEPATSPSFIIEPNAQEFGIKSELVHSPAGTIGFYQVRDIVISVIDNHTYAIISSSSNTIIKNITNIGSPTTVSNIAPHSSGSAFRAPDLKQIVTDDSRYVIAADGSAYLNIADISDIDNTDFFYRSNLDSVPGDVYPTTAHPVLINTSAYVLLGNYYGGIIIMNITSTNNVNFVHKIAHGNEYTKIREVYGLTTIAIEESVYALAVNAKYGVNYGLTIIDITNTSSPFLVSNETLGIGKSYSLNTVTIDESIYALVLDDYSSISIINITNPYSPELASVITNNNDGYTRLSDPSDITTVTIGTSTFALVTDQSSIPGIQIIDITNPYAPSPVSAIVDGQDYAISLTSGITTVTQDEQTYALVASRGDHVVLIIKLDYMNLISLTSNNTNPAYAKAGDTLKLEFNATDTISSNGNVEILGDTVGSSFSGETFTADRSVPSREIERYANFMVTVVDNAGNTLVVTEDDLSSNIFVDTKRPQISLIGDADLEVFPLTEESSIPGATATDGDPNYAGNYTITTNGTLSTALDGSVILFTYTAADDGAGNTGHSITRTVTVGQPNIIHFTSLNIASSSSDNFARATQSITVSLVTDGSELGNFTGTILGKQFTSATNGGSASFTIEATSDDPYENATFSITLTNASGNNITITNTHITDGSYVTVDTVYPTITLHDPDDVTVFTGSTTYVDPGATAYDASYGNKTISGTGTVDTFTSGTYQIEYKAPDDDAGNTGQIVIRTVTVMPKPFEFIRSLGVYEGPSLNHTTVNDATFDNVQAMASIQINDSTYIMAATIRYADAGTSMHAVHIFDITNIDSPRLVNKTVFHDNNGASFHINHITISTIDDNTYAIASAIQHSISSTPGVLIINISNPESPSLVTYVTNDQNFTGLSNPRRIAVTTMGEFTYALVPSSNPYGVVIMNITNPENPTLVIAIKDIENGGDYDILQGVEDIAIINTNARVYALVTARHDDGVQIIDITDISNPIPVSSIVDNSIKSSSPYRALTSPYGIDTISIGESIYALVASYTDHGVQIINITNPENPSSASAYVGSGLIQGAYDVSTITIGESIYALSTAYSEDSIVLFDITNPAHPQFVHRLSEHDSSTAGLYHDLNGAQYITTVTLNTSTYALVSSDFDGIQVINLASPDVSVFSNNTNNPSYAKTGDSLSITLMATDIIGSGSATILGLDADVSHVDENFTASVIVPSTIQEEYANFTVTLENNYGNTTTLARDNSAYSNQFLDNVFVDNIAPRISLDGSDPYYLVQNRTIVAIPTVTVTDGDPNYPKRTHTITTSNDLNTSKIGSTAIFTYTAKPDGAGNLGPSVTRNVTIVGYSQIDVTSLTVSSDNSVNSSYAKAGDNVTITIETDGIIETITGNILGGGNYMKSISSSLSTSTLTLTKTITQSDTNGNLTFSILATNSSNYAARATHEDLTTSNIIIDTISPTITLKGINNTVSVLDRTYVDQNATAYDLSYGSKNVPPTGTVDIGTEGNYTLTYSAPPDFAGNEAQSITRNVIVLDLPPISFNNVFDVSSAGSFKLATLSITRNHVNTFQIDTATYAGVSTSSGLYIMNITNIRSISNVSTVSHMSIIGTAGITYTDFVLIDGSTYALSGHLSGVLITDVTNPASPSYVAHTIDGQDGFTTIAGAISIATTTIDSSTYALVVSNNDNGVQIINITNPYNPTPVWSVSDGSGNFTTLSGARSIAITTIDSSTYALVASSIDDGVQIIDITTPSAPIAVKSITDGQGNFTTLDNAQHISITTIGSSTYALVASYSDNGAQIIDITNPSDPIAALSIKDGSGGYNELSGASYTAITTIGSSTYALVASYNDNGVQIIDITNPYQSTPASSITDGAGGFTELNGANFITTTTIGLSTYAMASSTADKDIQIINLNYPLTFESSNSNPAYAKEGDTLTLEFAVNDTIVSSTTQFINLAQMPSIDITNATSSAIYRATLTVPSDPIEAFADFVITLENNQSVTLSVTENDLPSNVFIDTVSPRIDLVGDQNHTVYVGTQNPIIPGAIAIDGSPGYSASYSTIVTGTLNTSIIDSNVTYTYTAHLDAAGNLGESVTRNVTVVDYEPITVTDLIAASDNSANSSYAKVGDEIKLTFTPDATIETVTGDILGDENFTFSERRGVITLSKIINQNDTNGNLTFDIFVSNSSGYAARITQDNLASSNIIIIDTVPPLIYLYGINNTISNLGSSYVDAGAISYDLSYGIKDVTGTDTVTTSQVGTYHITYDAPDFAGNPANIIRTVHVQQLAPISLTNEKSQFLVSPTANVSDSPDYPYLGDSYRVTTVKIGDSTYALIGAYEDDGFTILNITTPESPTLVFNATKNTKINADLYGPTGISTIQIENSIYAVITSLAKSRVAILDITNPTLPIVKSITTPGDNTTIHSPFAVSTVDIDGTAYALVASRGNSKIAIFNITNPMNLTQVSVLEHGADYTLGGVTITIPIKMDNSTYILTAARDNNSVGIIDISDPKMPKQVALFEDDLNLGLHSAHSIETISINGRTYALVTSPGEDAMQIIDVTHPLLSFPVSTVRHGTEYPALLKPHDVTAIKVEDSTYALLSAVTADTVQIIDITNPESPRPASHITHGTEYVQLDRPQTLKAVQINNTAYTLIASRDSNGIQIIKLEHEKTTQTPFSITSNNTNSSYAKAGDTVSVQISINDTIYSQTTQILNLATHIVVDPNTISASVTIPTDSIEMNASVTASITNYLGVTVNLTEANLTGANVFVDTISPKIELTGDANHTIFVNSNYEELGAVASDGDPNYIPNYTITTSGSLNNTMVGSFELYTYIADPDAAGNLGESVIRNVTVVDYEPITVTDLIAASDNSANSSYAKVGDEIKLTFTPDATIETVTGDILGDENFTFSERRGVITLSKIINQNDTNGNLTFDIFVSNSSGYAARITQDNLTSSNIIIDTVPPLLYLYGANNTVSYVGSPYVDAGAISYDLSYGILDVTGASTVTGTVGTYNVTYDAPDFAGNPANIIRIVHVQEIPQLSLSSESSNLLITPASTVTDSVDYPYLTDSHNIEIVQISDSIYALVTSYGDDGFTILNMTNPKSPSLVFNATRTNQNYSAIDGIVGTSAIQIQGNTYAVTISALTPKILIADITNPASPIVVSERSKGTDYPYLNAMTAISTFSIGNAAYAMIASQSNDWVAILNITEPANPTHLTVLQDGENYDLNGPRHIKTINADGSTFAVITARNGGTFTILNIDNPEMPIQTLVINDSADVSLSSATGIELVEINTRTYALVASSLDNAMQIIDITHPQLSFSVSTVHMSTNYSGLFGPHYVAALQVEDATYAFVTSPSTNSTQVIDITNPSQPNPVSVLQDDAEYTNLNKPFNIESVQIDDAAYALVASRDSNGIQIIKLGYNITTQTPFSITSNNTNSSYAKAGDTVSIQITVNDTLDQSKSTVQIQNLNANVNKTSLNTINASVTIPTDSIEINASITASITNYLDATLDLTETDLTAQNVFIDTISPTMKLIGDANHVVIVNNIYSEPGALAIDGSPGYNASNYSVIVTGNLNTSMINSTVNYTYTAYPDAAGNPGTSINRTVTIVDYAPLNVVILNVSSNNSVNNSYAKAGDNVTITLVTDGSDVETATGDILDDNNFAKNPSGNTIIFSKIITQSDPNGNLTFDILVTNSSGYASRVTQDNLANSNIIIDTIPPTITLNGKNDTISILNRAYTDANATAYDLSYGEKSILTNGIVNTNVMGNYSLSYTAESDLAGNVGPTITRNVIVKDLVSFEIQILSVSSTNVNNASYAKIGDNITVRLAVNDTIATHDVEILNNTLSLIVTNSTNEINATLSIPNNLAIEKYATFNIGIENSLTIPINVTQENITGSNIFVDTIPPTISINGDITEYSLLQNRSTDMIPNATATDGDPNYAGTYTVTNNTILNTSILGASATYTYTADPDGAGNLGESVDLIVTVTDYTQLNITALTVSSDNSNSSYARVGDQVNITLITDGSDIVNVTGTILGDASFTKQNSSGTITLSKTITQSDTNGNLTFDIFVTNSTGSAARVTQENILNNNNIIIDTVSPLLYLYGVNNTVSYVGSSYVDAGAISYDISYGIKDVTGTSTVTGTAGTYDVTYDAPDFAGNPANIIRIVHVQELQQLSLTSESSSLLLTPESPIADPVQYPHLTDPYHIETVQIDGSTYALVASNHDSGFTILNMDNPESPSLVFNATSTQTNYAAIQNILGASPIQIQGKTYVVTISPSGILIADITNPESTTFVSTRSNGTDYPYLHAMIAISAFSIGDAAYAMIASQTGSWVSILNITEPANPTHLTVLENGANYDLNSPRHIAIIDADGSTFAVITSRTTGTVTILNMDNPEMPVQIHAIKDGIDLALSSATGIELVQINTRTYALVVSNNDDAMQIIDITHPQLPFPVSTVQKSGTEYSGLNSPHYVAALQVEDVTYAFVTSPSANSTQVIDITNPSQPNPVAVLQNGTEYTHLAKPLYIESVHTDDAAYALVGARTSNGIEIIKLGYDITTQTPFSITSNNANNSYAKAGDIVSIQITVNDTIDQSKSTVQIQNLNANVDKTSLNTIEATVTIPTDSIEINASITALITSSLGATLNLTETDLTAQNVFIDTIPPTIELFGDANYAALVGTSYTDQGAIASDGSPGYNASNYSTSKTGNVNTSDIGSIVTYTYTAYDDAAGNPGASATRTVTVVDHEPINVTSLTVNSSNSVNNSYAKAGDNVTITLVTDGSDITNITGTILGDASFTKQNSSGTVTLSKIITQSDANGNLAFSIFVINSTDYASTVTQEDLTGENIIIDTIPPTITLNGNSETVEFGSTYTDLGANIADASYEDRTIYSETVVNTSMIGTYSLVYNAPDDPAGNLGPSVTRTIIVSDSTPRMLDSLSLSTSNNNPAYAKAGDNITVTLIANQPISYATTTIQNEVVTHTIQNDTLYANYTIKDSQNGNPTLEITANFASSLPLTVTESNLTSTILIDTEKPIITLIGHSNITTPIDQTYVDDSATVADNDPSYSGTVSLNDSGVDTTKENTYTIVYSADADNAGNIPDNVTRTVTVSGFVLSISSDNTYYDDLAKEGDLVSVKIVSDPYINSLIIGATILGRSADASSITGNTIYANTTVLDSDANDNIEFSITLNLTTGTLVTITNDNLTSANVVVDTIAPTMLSASTVTPTLVSMTFDESIAISSTIERRTAMTPTPMSINVQNGSSNVLEFVISSESSLSSDATPHIMIPASPPNIRDLAGNAAPEISITVSDGIAPSMQSATVTSSSLIEVMFDEEIKFLDGNPPFRPAPTVNGRPTDTPRDIFGDILHVPSQNAFPIDAVLNVSIRTTIITDIAGNVFEASAILTSTPNVLVSYTVDELTIHVPYAMTLNPNTLSTGDYRITFGSNPPSAISIVDLSDDATTVILTMNTRFGTGDTPFVEQIGTITDTFNNTVTMQSAIADDRAPPTLVSVIASSPSDITVTFSEKISSKSTSIQNYDLSGATIRNTGLGIADGTVVISTSTFVKASILISTSTTIEDISNNVIQGGVTQSVIKN